MANKKIFMSVTATAVIASAFIAAEEADAASHKVKSGDSLWAIAQKYNTTVPQLKSINNLTSDIIHPNQIIETDKKSGSGSTANSSSGSSGSSGSSSGTSTQPTKDATTYTVKRGDTLSGIASQYKISLSDLMKWNNLDTTLIFPGNVFVVSKSASSGSNSGSSSGSNASSGSGSSGGSGSGSSGNSGSSSSSVYTVKSGDTLSHIASRNGVTVANLKKWNNLSSDLILIGQKLSIGQAASSGSSSGSGSSNSGNSNSSSGNAASEKPTADVGYNVDTLISTAKSMLGVKYVWGGQTASGFDCSGFIHYAYNQSGKSGARLSTDGYYSRSYSVDKPQVGDLVFFKGTYRSGISHMGIYIGNNEFIHAGTSTGVTITNLNNSYWSKHFDSFKRFY